MRPAFDRPSEQQQSEPPATLPDRGDPSGEKEQINRLFHATRDLLATITPDGRLTLLNPAWEEVPEQLTLRAPRAVGSLTRWGPLARLHQRP
jgi:hypothetical protein